MRVKQKVKMRKSIRYFYLASAILILACSSISLLRSLSIAEGTDIKNIEIYSYENQFDYNYKVNLLSNPYIDEKTLEMSGNAYITDLIESIDLNLNYKYNANEESVINYEYEVKSYIEASYTKDGDVQKVWEKSYQLVDIKKDSATGNNISIEEKIPLNLKEKNSLVKQFEQQMGMNLDAKYLIIINIKTTTKIEEEQVENKYTSTISMDLAEKTTKINGENNKKDKKYISREVRNKTEFDLTTVIVCMVLDIIAIIVLRYVTKQTKSTNHIKDEYRQELNRILRLCQDKIVQVNSDIDIKNDRVIDVKDFGEIIKVSEELFKPILYWSSKDSDEAWFSVVSNHITYRYILKR